MVLQEGRILVDFSSLTAGRSGIGRYVADLGEGLAAVAGEFPELKLLGLAQPRRGLLEAPDVCANLRHAVNRARSGGDSSRMTHPRWAYGQRLSFGRAARFAGADLVHTPQPVATPLGLGCRRIVTCHDLIPLRFPNEYLDWRDGYLQGRTWLDRRRYRGAAHVIAISQTTADDLVELVGVNRSVVSVVYNGVNLERFHPEARPDDHARVRALGLSPGKYLLYVGAADHRKNARGMFAALRHAHDRGHRELVLAWAGQLRPDRHATVTGLAAEFGVEHAVKRLGYVDDDDLFALYRQAVAKVFVSLYEGFGYPVIEAMASGCPVITSSVTATAEIAGDAAFLVDPLSPSEIGEAMIAALAMQKTDRQAWVERGLRQAAKFSHLTMARETAAVYARCLLDHST